jgi:hypothetical protein
MRYVKLSIVGMITLAMLIFLAPMPSVILECLADVVSLRCSLEVVAASAGALMLGIGLITIVLRLSTYFETPDDNVVVLTIPLNSRETIIWKGDAASEQNVPEFLSELRRTSGDPTSH